MVETKHHDHSCNISNLILFVILSSFVIIIAYVIQFRGATIANYPISPHKINEWIDQQKYPLIVQVCQEILQKGFISKDRFNDVFKNEKEWKDELSKSNLFQFDKEKLFFGNVATKEYIKAHLENNK